MMMLLMLLMILMMMIQIYGAAEGRTRVEPLLATAPLPRTLHPTPRGVEIAPEMARGTPAMAATSFLPMFLPATPISTHCLSAGTNNTTIMVTVLVRLSVYPPLPSLFYFCLLLSHSRFIGETLI
jgi:hypothetical protein